VTTTERNIHLALLGASLALAVWVFAAPPPADEPATPRAAHALTSDQRSPLALIPPGSAFVLSADARALARAPLGGFILERIARSAGPSQLAKVCGFEPLTRLEQLALAVPSADLAAQEHPEDFGIVASGRFTAAEITRCAKAAIAARGGDAIQTKLGSFESVRDRRASSGEIASKDGLVVVSGGSYFRELLDSAEGHAAPRQNEANAALHAELRAALGSGQLLVTWLLGEGWFARVAGDESNARLSPLSALKTLAARVAVADRAELRVLLDCADSEGASRVASLLGELRSSLRALPLDPALATLATRVSVVQTGPRLTLTLELNQAELAPVLDALLDPSATKSEP